MNLFFKVVLKFLKIHYQYGSNVHWEGYINLKVIFNHIRELFTHTLETIRFLDWNASSCFDMNPIFLLCK
jgi:hypothetical protein